MRQTREGRESMAGNNRVWAATLFLMFGAAAMVGVTFAAPPPPMTHAASAGIPAFLPVTVTGEGVRAFADVAGAKATVMIFVACDCPISNGYAPEYVRLDKQLKSSGGRLVLVYSNPGDLAGAQKHAAKFNLGGISQVLDDDQSLLKRLGATTTPEAFILDEKRVVRYCGSIDDKYVERGKPTAGVRRKFLSDALSQVMDGKFVLNPRTEAFGCAIESKKTVAEAGAPTYAADVAPILNANCVSCHREGETAPMPLDTFEAARRFADNIAGITARKQMPPWKPIAGHGDFKGTRRLTDGQIATLTKWAASGAAPGDLLKAPAPPRLTPGWSLGKPDLILTMPEDYQIPASGPDIYRCFVLPIPIDGDREVVAVEYRPGNRRVVHHVIGYLDGAGEGRRRDDADPGLGYTSFGGPGFLPTGELAGWIPGLTPQPLPSGVARRLEKGSDLVMQVHYHPSGKPETDRTQVGIYFGKTKAEKLLRILPIVQFGLDIPAGDAKHEVTARFPVPLDAKGIFIVPHMHLLGRSVRVDAELPGGTTLPLLQIDDWDFNWQDMYTYKVPVTLPRGTVLTLTAIYDNSDGNPRQPVSPPRRVTWGEQTTDEMCLALVGFVAEREDDPFVKMYDALLHGAAKKRLGEKFGAK